MSQLIALLYPSKQPNGTPNHTAKERSHVGENFLLHLSIYVCLESPCTLLTVIFLAWFATIILIATVGRIPVRTCQIILSRFLVMDKLSD